MSEAQLADTPVVAANTIFVQRTIKLAETQVDPKDESGSGDTEIIEVHKFATQPSEVEAGLSIRKSQQADNGDWVAGELTIKVRLACYTEEALSGAATERAYALVKDQTGIHLPKMLTALNQLAKR